MKILTSFKDFTERQAFGVCSFLGERLSMRSSVIRLFFIYASFLSISSPLIIYMTVAFWMKMKAYVGDKRTSFWDL